jgi:hypothetical protein
VLAIVNDAFGAVSGSLTVAPRGAQAEVGRGGELAALAEQRNAGDARLISGPNLVPNVWNEVLCRWLRLVLLAAIGLVRLRWPKVPGALRRNVTFLPSFKRLRRLSRGGGPPRPESRGKRRHESASLSGWCRSGPHGDNRVRTTTLSRPSGQIQLNESHPDVTASGCVTGPPRLDLRLERSPRWMNSRGLARG